MEPIWVKRQCMSQSRSPYVFRMKKAISHNHSNQNSTAIHSHSRNLQAKNNFFGKQNSIKKMMNTFHFTSAVKNNLPKLLNTTISFKNHQKIEKLDTPQNFRETKYFTKTCKGLRQTQTKKQKEQNFVSPRWKSLDLGGIKNNATAKINEKGMNESFAIDSKNKSKKEKEASKSKFKILIENYQQNPQIEFYNTNHIFIFKKNIEKQDDSSSRFGTRKTVNSIKLKKFKSNIETEDSSRQQRTDKQNTMLIQNLERTESVISLALDDQTQIKEQPSIPLKLNVSSTITKSENTQQNKQKNHSTMFLSHQFAKSSAIKQQLTKSQLNKLFEGKYCIEPWNLTIEEELNVSIRGSSNIAH